MKTIIYRDFYTQRHWENNKHLLRLLHCLTFTRKTLHCATTGQCQIKRIGTAIFFFFIFFYYLPSYVTFLCRFHPVKPASSPQAPVEARHEGAPPSLLCLWCKSSRSNASRKYVELEVRQKIIHNNEISSNLPVCGHASLNTSCLFYLINTSSSPPCWIMTSS